MTNDKEVRKDNLDGVFNDCPVVKRFIQENKIESISDFKLNDLLSIIRNTKDYITILNRYILLKNQDQNSNQEKKLKQNNLLIKIFEEKKKSKWSFLNKVLFKYNDKNIIVRKLFQEYVENYSVNHLIFIEYIKNRYKKNNIIELYQKDFLEYLEVFDYLLERYKVLILNDMVKYEYINESFSNLFILDDYSTFINKLKEVIKEYDYYLYPSVRSKYGLYLYTNNIYRISDLIRYLTIDTYNKERKEIIYLKELYSTHKTKIFGDEIIDNYFKEKSITSKEIVIFLMRIKKMKYNDIKKHYDIKTKEISIIFIKVLQYIISFFDSYEGLVLLRKIMSFENGYVSIDILRKYFPKYFLIIEYIAKKKFLYKLRYIEVLDIYVNKKVDINKLSFENIKEKIITDEMYNNIINRILNECILNKIFISKDHIISCINKVYKKQLIGYVKGYLSVEYKFYMIYYLYFKKGILKDNIYLLEKYFLDIYKDKIDTKYILYVYCTYIDNTYYIKKKLFDKYSKISSNDLKYAYDNKSIVLSLCDKDCKELLNERYIVMRVAESYRNIFDINDIRKEINIPINKIRNYLNKINSYFQLSYSKYIQNDKLVCKGELLYVFQNEKLDKESIYNRVKTINKEFLDVYKIKDKKYLYRIYRYYHKLYNND